MTAQPRFDHKTYVPFLKGKQGELGALRDLRGRARGRTVPLLDVVPPRATNPQRDLDLLIDRLGRWWGTSERLFVDPLHVPVNALVGNAQNAVEYLFAAARTSNLAAVPVTGIRRDPAYQTAVAAHHAHRGSGVGVRLEPHDVQRAPAALDAELTALLGSLGVSRADADLLIRGSRPQPPRQ